jgi:putative nucleotidyltransferase with HDIG domain
MLEQRVQEQTADLARTNKSLQTEIAQRKQAAEELEQSLKKVERIMESTIQAMSLAVEAKDRYTAGHQRRVTQLACAIAKEMNLSCEQTKRIRIAALLHDMGKIHIPTEILSKPGRLSEIEFAMIKTHPQTGYEIVKTIDFPSPTAEIVLQHHERLDGSGYCSGLRGESILLEARILAVSDVVEAMSSHRPYRPALGTDKALEEISQNRGRLYDPDVVDACLKVFQTGTFKFERIIAH